MNIFFYAFLIVLFIHPIFGTLLFVLVENLKIAVKAKVIIVTFGHSLFTAIFIWLVCSTFNKEMGETAVFLVAGSLLRVPFSDRKYFLTLTIESGVISIEYFTELLNRKVIKLTNSEILRFEQSVSQKFIEKPSELVVTSETQNLTFQILDKTTKVSL